MPSSRRVAEILRLHRFLCVCYPALPSVIPLLFLTSFINVPFVCLYTCTYSESLNLMHLSLNSCLSLVANVCNERRIFFFFFSTLVGKLYLPELEKCRPLCRVCTRSRFIAEISRAKLAALSSRSAAIFKNTFQFICCISRDAVFRNSARFWFCF